MADVYQIRVRGHLGAGWSEWFAGLRITNEANGEAVLTGPVADQAALHGLLARVRDLGLPLLAVTRVPPDDAEASDPPVPRRARRRTAEGA
jgi:hypothetical protein